MNDFTETFKIPISILVVVIRKNRDILLIKRVPYYIQEDFWQSVTGSVASIQEPLFDAAAREVQEELGIQDCRHTLIDLQKSITYDIYDTWRHRYAPGVFTNTEHWFLLPVDMAQTIQLNPAEHTDFVWLNGPDAIKKCYSPANQAAIAYAFTHGKDTLAHHFNSPY